MAMRHLLVSAAAVMAITGAAAVGNAQMQDKGPGQERSPGAERGAPPSAGTERAPEEKTQQAPSNREQKSEPRKGAEREPGRDKQPRAAQQGEPQRDKSATQPGRDQDKQKSTEQQRQSDQDKQKAADQRKGDQDKQKSTEQQRQRDQDKQKAADQRKGDQEKQKSAKDSDKSQTGRIQVTEEKRSGVRERLVKERGVERISRSRINVSINIGTTLPRSVRLHRFPTTIVSFAPAYRGYSYVLLDDETIVVVDERTYVIVDVIPAGTQRADRPGRAHLTLSADDMRYIYRTAPKSRTASVRVRLALGAEVPRDVELLAFPDEIVERVPDMRRYRYIVTDGDIVVVDPDDHAVALVINE
jgi:hypothetical protein